MRNLFQELTETERRAFVQAARRRTFAAGDKVYWQGDHGDALHLVTKGSFVADVATPQGQQLIVNVFHRDDVFGELALFGNAHHRNATITALEPSETRSLTRDQFEQWRARVPRLDRLIVDALADRLREMTDQLMESVYLPIDDRVMRRLLTLHEAFRPHEPAGGWIPIRQEELASYCGIARPTVNRILRQLAADGLVELGRGRLRVTDEPELRRRARPGAPHEGGAPSPGR
jgi:CRP-like cAMP-binding protein